jgi:hypothetical protein
MNVHEALRRLVPRAGALHLPETMREGLAHR